MDVLATAEGFSPRCLIKQLMSQMEARVEEPLLLCRATSLLAETDFRLRKGATVDLQLEGLLGGLAELFGGL
jgi:hypothetical protein